MNYDEQLISAQAILDSEFHFKVRYELAPVVAPTQVSFRNRSVGTSESVTNSYLFIAQNVHKSIILC